MASSSQSSAFQGLPAEIRNRVYHYALSARVFEIYCWRRYTPFGIETRVPRKETNFVALLAVCHQIYAETRLLPFQLNIFRFKSQDAFRPWLDKFTEDQRGSIQEVHIVTWRAKHMVEGEGWVSKPLNKVFPVQDLPGLKRVEVEVNTNGKARDCIEGNCLGCKGHGDEVDVEEEELKKWLMSCNRGLKVGFRRLIQ